MSKDGWSGLELPTNMMGRGCQLADDDLSVTNTERSGEATNKDVRNSILIKSKQMVRCHRPWTPLLWPTVPATRS
jgi:enolase